MKQRLLLIFSLFLLITTGRMTAQEDIYPEVIQLVMCMDSSIVDVFTPERGYTPQQIEELKYLTEDDFSAVSDRGMKAYFNEYRELVYFHEVNAGDNVTGAHVVTCQVTGLGEFKLHFFVIPCPDNIDVAECRDDPVETKWEIDENWASGKADVATYFSPIIGDLNDDGYSEIVVAKYSGPTGGNLRVMKNLYVFDGANRNTLTEILTPHANYMPAGNAGLARPTRESNPYIYLISWDGYLYAYDIKNLNNNESEETNYIWKSNEIIVADYTPTSFNSSSNSTNTYGSVAFADFNNDGIAEVYAADRIFNAETGEFLLEVPPGPKGKSRTLSSAYQYMPAVADITGDGKLEYIVGSRIYTVTIDPNTPANNKMELLFDMGGSTSFDGLTILVDMNKDGYLDVVVFSTTDVNTTDYTITIWDIKNKEILGTTTDKTAGNYYVGVPFVGDVDADGNLEILLTSHAGTVNSVNSGYVNGYRWDSETGEINRVYRLITNDTSGSTGITLFDFNQSGKAKLVYRDEANLRIIEEQNGKLVDIATKQAGSGTFLESAVVADVDSDGQAEIITVGNSARGGTQGTLRIFKTGNAYPWAPARKVWNQYAYNVVNVNDDLTIPKYRMNQARVFSYDENGNPVQPYNNFLQQQTILDQTGKPFRPLPHAVWKYEPEYIRQDGKITIKATIENIGDVDLTIPVSIVVYAEEVHKDYIIGKKDYTGEGGVTVLKPGNELKIDVSFDLDDERSLSKIVITVNDDGTGTTVQDQCNFVSQDIIYFVQAKDDHVIKEGIPEETVIDIFSNDFLGSGKDPFTTKFELVIPNAEKEYVPEKDWGSVSLGTGIYPKYGTIALDDANNVIYTPNDAETFPGRDEFTYKLIVEDKNSYLIAEATVVIEFFEAKDDSYAVSDYSKIELDLTLLDDLLKNPEDDTEIDPNRPVTIILPDKDNGLLMPKLGTLAFDADDDTKVYFTPGGNDGLDVFEYQITYENPNADTNDPEATDLYIVSTATVYLWVLNEDRVTCTEEEAITLEIPDGAAFTWYDSETGGNVIDTENGTLFLTKEDENEHVKEIWVAMSFTPDGSETDLFTEDRIRVRVRFLPVHMYWNKEAEDNDWHNYANWTNEEGEPFDPLLEFLPSECTIVHIPGDADVYPILDEDNTSRTIGELENLVELGEPTCDQIIFHFGGEVARPDLLVYNKAFVHYNVGYYDKEGDLHNSDPLSSTPIARDRWYGLAVPLKKVATGDFSFGGWPNTWQMAFERNTVGIDWIGEFTTPFSTNATELSANYAYSYSLWVNGYSADRGSVNQSGLNAVKGIIELPYYENEEASKAHRIHSYNPSNKTSSFQYYYWQTDGMPLVPANEKEFGKINRGNNNEAYRFIIDDKTTVTGGKSGFRMTVPAKTEIMVGNPMMSTLDFDKFYAVNSNSVESYYRLYDGTFETYEYNVGNATIDQYISPLQAFFVSTKGTTGNVNLIFPFENVSVTRPASDRNTLRSSVSTTGKPDVLYIVAECGTKSASATLGLQGFLKDDIPALFYPGTTGVAQLYFINEAGQRNAVQYGSYGQETKFGYLMNDPGQVTLSFRNLEQVNATSLILTDQWTGKEQDLLIDPSYTFESTGSSFTDRFLLKVGDRTNNPTGNDSIGDSDWNVRISNQNNDFIIRSNRLIDKVQVYDLQGVLRSVRENISADYYAHPVSGHGVCIVKITASDGQEKVCKVTY